MLPTSPRATAALCLCLGLLAAGTVRAQSEAAEAPRDGGFGERTEVQVVEIPVQVTRDGKPVRGLAAADFQVLLGKDPQKIVGFEVVDLATIAAAGPGAPAAAPPVPISGRRHFLFLFDLSTAEPPALARAQDAALQVVEQRLHPSDLAAVAVYSPAKGAVIQLAFTSDRGQIRLAIETLGASTLLAKRPDWLGLVIAEAEDAQQSMQGKMRAVLQTNAGEPGEGSRAGGVAASERIAMAQDILDYARLDDAANDRAMTSAETESAESFTRSLRDLAGLMQRVEGRKHVVFLSQGFDSDLIVGRHGASVPTHVVDEEAALDTWSNDGERRFGSSRLRTELHKALAEMRHADCVIHAVDVGGLGATGGDISSHVAADMGANEPQRRKGEDSLFVMAEETGGQLYRNTNDLAGAMGRVLAATEVTYLLAVQPQQKLAGSVPVRVTVSSQRGVDVSHREVVHATAPPAVQAGLEERLRLGALVLDGSDAGTLRPSILAVPLLEGTEVIVEVPGPQLLRGHSGDLLSADISVYAFAPDGAIAKVVRQLAGMDLRQVGPRLEASGVKLFARMDLPPGSWSVRALVRNTITGSYGVTATAVTVPDLELPSALSAAFVDPSPEQWLLVRDAASSNAGYPFAFGDQILLPVRPVGLARDTARSVWVAMPAASGELTVEGVVRTPDGREVSSTPLALLGRLAAPEGERLLASFSPGGLPAGDYLLELRVRGEDVAAAGAPLPFSVAP